MGDANPLHVLHITDLHLYEDSDTELYGVRTDKSFRAVLDAGLKASSRSPDAVLVTGDIAEDCSRGAYERFRSIMQGIDAPVLCLPGNHDDPDLAAQVLNDGNLSFCRTTDIRPWRFIMLDSHLSGDDGGLLSDVELKRLESELNASGDLHVLVTVHHQPMDMGSAWLDGCGLRNGPALLSLLSSYRNVRAVLWGHVHQASDRELDGVRMLSTPSTCAQFTPGTGKCVMDTRPPAFRVLTLLSDGGIDTDVAWLEDWTVAERPPDSRTADSGGDRQ